MPRRPPGVVSTRTLAAEACASAALALTQRQAVWEALTTLALVVETADARQAEGPAAVGRAVLEVLAGVNMLDGDVDQLVATLETVDHTARSWALLAHPPSSHAAPQLSVVE